MILPPHCSVEISRQPVIFPFSDILNIIFFAKRFVNHFSAQNADSELPGQSQQCRNIRIRDQFFCFMNPLPGIPYLHGNPLSLPLNHEILYMYHSRKNQVLSRLVNPTESYVSPSLKILLQLLCLSFWFVSFLAAIFIRFHEKLRDLQL